MPWDWWSHPASTHEDSKGSAAFARKTSAAFAAAAATRGPTQLIVKNKVSDLYGQSGRRNVVGGKYLRREKRDVGHDRVGGAMEGNACVCAAVAVE